MKGRGPAKSQMPLTLRQHGARPSAPTSACHRFRARRSPRRGDTQEKGQRERKRTGEIAACGSWPIGPFTVTFLATTPVVVPLRQWQAVAGPELGVAGDVVIAHGFRIRVPVSRLSQSYGRLAFTHRTSFDALQYGQAWCSWQGIVRSGIGRPLPHHVAIQVHVDAQFDDLMGGRPAGGTRGRCPCGSRHLACTQDRLDPRFRLFLGGAQCLPCRGLRPTSSLVSWFYHWGSGCRILPSLTTPCYLHLHCARRRM
jgi:hypothetical protein